MAENKARCLAFTPREAAKSEQVESLLGQLDIFVTVLTTQRECLDQLVRDSWDLLVVDAVDDREEALSLLSQFKATTAGVTTLALVSRGDIGTTVRAMKAGATDCIEIPIDKTKLTAAVAVLDEPAKSYAADARQKLTKTERLVLHHILDGRTSAQIAEKLCRSPRTIDVHRRNIMRKMNVDGIVGLVRQTLGADGDF